MQLPSTNVLRTATLKLLELYVRWLFGAEVWGLATYDENGNARATPHVSHVKMLGMAVCTKVAKYTNSTVDIAEAFKWATEDKELKFVHFMQGVTMDIASNKCTDCTAPGFG